MSGIKLQKRSNIYFFRSKIPLDIFPYINRREIWNSLKTDDYKTAKVIASKLLYDTERLFLHVSAAEPEAIAFDRTAPRNCLARVEIATGENRIIKKMAAHVGRAFQTITKS